MRYLQYLYLMYEYLLILVNMYGIHSVGPPYLLERSDLKRLVGSWVQFVPR